MLLFGHTGITLGITLLLRETRNKRLSVGWFSRIADFASYLDMRIILIGSLLPDIIDKPLGRLFFREALGNGRTFAHTLFFLILITLAATYLYRLRGTTWLLAIAFGTFTHLIFDQMWRYLRTFLWPVYGFAFERADIADYIGYLWNALLTEPAVYIPEIIGVVILAGFAIVLLRKRKIIWFLRHGQF